MPFARIKGVRIFYDIEGEGEVVTFLHHGFGSSVIWKKIAPEIRKAGYKTLVYDRRGYGISEEGEDFEEFYTGEGFRRESVEELLELLKFLGVEKTHLVGQCEGGVIGADFAALFPEMVLSLTMSSTMCYSGVTVEEFNRKHFPPRFEDLDEYLKKKLSEWHGKNAKRRYELFSRYGGAYGRGVFDLRDTLKKIECPALVIYPDRSSLFDVEQGVMLYKNLPKGELCVIPRCGHNTYEYRPEEYTYQILSFYRRIKNRETTPGF